MSLKDKPKLLFIYFLICSIVIFYCYLKTEIVLFLFVSLITLIVNIFIFINSFKFKKKENNVLNSNYFKVMGTITDVSNEKVQGGFCIHVSYKLGEKEYQIKSKSLNYNPNHIIQLFQIKEIPVLISSVDNNKVIVDDSYLNSYMVKRNEEANKLFGNFETDLKWIKKNQRHYYFFGIMFLLLSIIYTITNYIYNSNNIPFKLYIITIITFLITYIFLKKKLLLREKGFKLTGYIENIVYNSDISYESTNLFRRPHYIVWVSYIYNNKVYLIKSSRIYLKFTNKSSKFIPVYIDKNNPSRAYVDISYLK